MQNPPTPNPSATPEVRPLRNNAKPRLVSFLLRLFPKRKKSKNRLRGMLSKERQRKRHEEWRRSHKLPTSFSRPHRPRAAASVRLSVSVPVAEKRVFLPVEKPTYATQSTHGIWEGKDGKKLFGLQSEEDLLSAEAVPAPRPHRGFLSGLFARRQPTPSVLPEVAVPGSAPAASPAPADLDALLSEPSPVQKPARRKKDQPAAAPAAEGAPELPSAALMQEDAASPEPVARRASAKQIAPEKPRAKETAASAPAPQVPTKAPEVAPETKEIVYKSRPVYRVSAFGEFIGSIKYVGLGKERFSVIQNLATMLNAGLPLIDSLKTLQLETRLKPMKKLLGRIMEQVENGSPLWRAMEEQHFFSPHAIALVRIGEEAGSLAENMEYLAAQQEKDQALRNKVKMAMIYPTIVMVLMFVIVIGLGMFVLPNLIGVLSSLNVELPLATRLVILFTKFFTTYGATAVPSMIGGIIILTVLCKFTPLKVVSQWVFFKIPGIGSLAREATIARFGVILGGLLKAGVPLIDALKSLEEVTPIVSYRRFYGRLLEHITLGDSFSKSFQVIRGSEKLLPVSMQQLIVTGEKSGSLADILLKVADIYEKKANGTAEKLPVILEPILLLFIGGLVGTIAFAIIVPIYSIVGNIAK